MVRYARAQGWNDLVQAFQNSFTDSAMDELILLLYSKGPRPHGWKSGFARPLVYDRLEDVTSGIALQTPKHLDGPPIPHPSTAGTDNRVDDSHGREREQGDAPHVDATEDENEQDLVAQESHEVQTPELQAKFDAARKIQAACVRHLERKKAAPTGIHATRARSWSQLQARAAEMAWSSPSRYKFILQGPLVHVLVCLDALGAAAGSAKREVKKRSKAAHHEELEELMESQVRYRLGPSCPPLSVSHGPLHIHLADSSRPLSTYRRSLGHLQTSTNAATSRPSRSLYWRLKR